MFSAVTKLNPAMCCSRAPAARIQAPAASTALMGGRLVASPTTLIGFKRSMGHAIASPLLKTTTGGSRRNSAVCAGWRNGGGSADIPDRVFAALPYLLPLFDGLRYGKFLFVQYPIFSTILSPFEPLMKVYFSFPFASLIAFFAVYLGIINSTRFSRYVRFNAMQAVLLDIILILPGLIESVLRVRPMGGPGLQLYITGYNTIFIFIFACVLYGVGSCMAGRNGRLPLVADAADAQIR